MASFEDSNLEDLLLFQAIWEFQFVRFWFSVSYCGVSMGFLRVDTSFKETP